MVGCQRTSVFAKADNEHFDDSALIVSLEYRMDFDPVADNDTVCLEGQPVTKDIQAVLGGS